MDDIALYPGYCYEQDPNTPIENPLDGDLCIGFEELLDIYNHNLGPDCICGTSDDGPKDEFYCPPGYEYDYNLCQCKPTTECFALCENILEVPNPLVCGECLS